MDWQGQEQVQRDPPGAIVTGSTGEMIMSHKTPRASPAVMKDFSARPPLPLTPNVCVHPYIFKLLCWTGPNVHVPFIGNTWGVIWHYATWNKSETQVLYAVLQQSVTVAWTQPALLNLDGGHSPTSWLTPCLQTDAGKVSEESRASEATNSVTAIIHIPQAMRSSAYLNSLVTSGLIIKPCFNPC